LTIRHGRDRAASVLVAAAPDAAWQATAALLERVVGSYKAG
jgi:hypothetical protein